MAVLHSSETGFKIKILIPTWRTKYKPRVKFDPCNGEKDVRKWPYIKIRNLAVNGEYNKDKVDIDSLIKWIKENKKNINRIINDEINWTLFINFLRFSRNSSDLEDFLHIKKERSGLPLDVWIDECYYKYKTPSVICTHEDNFVGIVDLIWPEQSIFIKGYEKHAASLSEWVKKYRTQIIEVYYHPDKISGLDFCSMVEHEYLFGKKPHFLHNLKNIK